MVVCWEGFILAQEARVETMELLDTTIHAHVRARGVGCGRGRQENNGITDLALGTAASCWHERAYLADMGLERSRVRIQPVTKDEPWGDSIYPNPVTGPLDGDRIITHSLHESEQYISSRIDVPICDDRASWTFKCNTTPQTIVDSATRSTLFARICLRTTKNRTVLIHGRCFYQSPAELSKG